ncbi:DUF4097 domain-containing protein [Streptomyces sp. NPDC048718]|uniref:DUF4097 family beta strand repeat-containing protein n=1 Tax=Streptomyces sp. NPDC048718 TaxID=3365587 RepID=UPI003715C2D6
MRRNFRLLGIAVTTAGLAIGGLSGCGLVKSKTYEDSGSLPAKITSVRLENGSGHVTVHGIADGEPPSLRRTVSYQHGKPEGPTHRVENGVLILDDCGSFDCSVAYDVEVPAGIPVSGKVSNGTVSLTKVGAVRVKTGAGRIELTGVNGPVDVTTANGRITGSDVKGGRVQARTSNGSIDLTLAAPLDVEARTTNGSIALKVPGTGYRIAARTSNGDKRIGLPDDPAGLHRLTLKSSHGSISVENP